MRKPESVLENETNKILWEFLDTNGSSNTGQKARPRNNYFEVSSSYRAGSTDITDPLSPLLPIVHRPR